MNGLRRLYRGQTDIDFPKWWRVMLAVSGVLVGISVISFIVSGLNLSIDFEGGSVWEMPATAEQLSVNDARDVLAPFGADTGAKVQEVTDPSGKRFVRVQAGVKDVAESAKIARAYADRIGIPITEITTSTVGASWGDEITSKARNALVVFLIVIGLYIAWQLEWRMAVAALAAVVHDIVITVGVYSVTKFEVTPATVISFLTILGFSLYDTIVVYDRVRENGARYDRSGQYTYTAIMRRSLNQVLMRSINTTLVAILPVLSMLIIGALAFGQKTIEEFSLALLVGLVLGAYSSVAIAAPLTTWLKEKEPKYLRIRQRLVDRGELELGSRIPVDGSMRPASQMASGGADLDGMGDADGAGGERPSKLQVAVAARASQYQRPHPPRPRKQGKTR